MLIPARVRLVLPTVVLAATRVGYAQATFTANDYVCFQNLHATGDMRADVDGNGALNANDFIRFQQLYAERDPRANCDGSQENDGWTNLTPPPGSLVVYVAANGDDSNPGTMVLPFRSLSRGVAALRPGRSDQCLLRCGDTFNEVGIDMARGSNSETSYMVIGSYGIGPRPKVRTSQSAFGIYGVTGLAIVGLDIQPSAGHPGNAIWMPEGSKHILLEDCYIAGYGVNIASHATVGGSIVDFRIRRCVIVDPWSNLPQSGHNVFLGDQVNPLLEENVIDRGGRDGGEQTVFRRNVYIHDHGSSGVRVIGNVHARSCSDSIQVRPGGVVLDNLSLQNPTGMTWGGNGSFSYNVAIDARDINTTDRRGTGFELSGTGTAEYNIVAHNVNGTDAIVGYAMNGFTGMFRGNFLYDWKAPAGACWAASVQWEGGGGIVTASGNRLYQPNRGMIWRHESAAYGTRFEYSGGSYYTSTPPGGCGGYDQFSPQSGVGMAWAEWRPREANSVFLAASPVYDLTLGTYLYSVGVTPGPDPIATFMDAARQQSRQNWRLEFTADAFNDWARSRAGLPPN